MQVEAIHAAEFDQAGEQESPASNERKASCETQRWEGRDTVSVRSTVTYETAKA